MLRAALAPLTAGVSVAWIFGSMARGAEVSCSDIDLLVLGDVGFADLVRAVHPTEELLRRDVNPVLYSAEEFDQKLLKGDAFVSKLLAKPKLMVIGEQRDVVRTADDSTVLR